jgi:hypothetical protein
MELVLNLHELGVSENGGNGEDARRETGWLSWTVRLTLALAAVAAAYFIMTDPLPAALIDRIVGSAPVSVPGPVGTLLASLPCAG